MASNQDFSIIAKVVLDVADIQKQLNGVSKGIKFDIDSKGLDQAIESAKDAGSAVNKLDEDVQNATLTWQQYREMLDTAVDIMKDFAEQTYEVDSAITELKKVTDLHGDALDIYVDGLTEAGRQVARTGKPNRSEPE